MAVPLPQHRCTPYVLVTFSWLAFIEYHTVWGIFWIAFEIAVLTGFVLLGVTCFKLSKDQMYTQAGA